jgi:hypothetical protein
MAIGVRLAISARSLITWRGSVFSISFLYRRKKVATGIPDFKNRVSNGRLGAKDGSQTSK